MPKPSEKIHLTRAEHYARAEKFLATAEQRGNELLIQEQMAFIALAQAHATLATVVRSVAGEPDPEAEEEINRLSEVADQIAAQREEDSAAKLDPRPYVSREGIYYDAASVPLYGSELRFAPREGYEQRQELYPEEASEMIEALRQKQGTDPKPYVSEKGIRYAVGDIVFSDVPQMFLPRAFYLQEIEHYKGASYALDPKPWRYDLLGGPVEQRAREAKQETGGFAFAPRKGYEQNRELYR